MVDPLAGPRVRALVLRSAGTNCDGETVRALELAGAGVDLLHLNALSADPARLSDYQILVELGLFEPLEDPRSIALTDNASSRFECRWVTLCSEPCAVPWLRPGERMPVPVAHAEGRFVVRDRRVLERLFERGQVALTYSGPEPSTHPTGPDSPSLPYPLNPNGSIANIAGLCDPTGRVLGLMPHPERNLAPWNHPRWTRMEPRREGEGLSFYRRVVAAAGAGAVQGSRIHTTHR